jgi:hypothetical protein
VHELACQSEATRHSSMNVVERDHAREVGNHVHERTSERASESERTTQKKKKKQ